MDDGNSVGHLSIISKLMVQFHRFFSDHSNFTKEGLYAQCMFTGYSFTLIELYSHLLSDGGKY